LSDNFCHVTSEEWELVHSDGYACAEFKYFLNINLRALETTILTIMEHSCSKPMTG